MFQQELSTKRVALDPLGVGDRAFFLRLQGNLRVRRFLGGPVGLEKADKQFETYLRGHPNLGIWCVREHGQTAPIGIVVLSPHVDGGGYEISFQFDPSSWGLGLAFDACERVVGHGLDDLGCERIIAETQSANLPSIRMLQRLGFAPIRTVDRHGAKQTIYAAFKTRY